MEVEMTRFPWYSVGKVLICVWLPLTILLFVALPMLGIDFFDYPNIGYWVWIAFCFWAGWSAKKWFPAKE